MTDKATLLIADDDELIQDALTTFFEEHFNVISAMHLKDVQSALMQCEQPPDYALVDLGLPPTPHQPSQGFAVLSVLQAQAPDCAVVVVSGQNAKLHGQRARALGASDYAEKPCAPQLLLKKLKLAQQLKQSQQNTSGLVGNSAAITTLRKQIALIAPVAFPVLIEGESGVGKELVARALHDSSRRGKPFLAINCASIPEHLVEPTLFGSIKGSYTGSTRDNAGYLGDAADGTLLLDEVADLPETVQPKLLRVLETGEYQRVGETKSNHCTARIIAASNRSQQRHFSAGHVLRDDLYYRLSVFTITVPPLRQLGDDCMLLLEYFCRLIANDLATEPFELDEAATAMWQQYRFPGNVRELKNIVARLQVKYSSSKVSAEQLAEELCDDGATDIINSLPPVESLQLAEETRRVADSLAAQTAKQVLSSCNGNVSQAARTLRISEHLFESLLTLS